MASSLSTRWVLRRLRRTLYLSPFHAFRRQQPSHPFSSGSGRESYGKRGSFPSWLIGCGAFGLTAAAAGGLGAYQGGIFTPFMVQLEAQNEDSTEAIALNPEKWVEFKLTETARVSHNCKLFRFRFDPNTKLGLDIASCILTRVPLGEDADGKTKYVVRPYTPISDPEFKGYFDLLIKIYPEGKMSPYLAKLKPGDVVEVKGPIEKLRYSPNMKKQIGMIAGGTGITPMLQVVKAILKNPDDNTQVSLLYGNISPDDILLKAELDRLAAGYPNFKVFYTVDNPSGNWRAGAGYISKDMILKGLPGPGEDTVILVCGPPGMMENISGGKAKDWTQGELKGLLKELGYTKEMVYKF